jgi:hypothetical protein
MLSLGKHYNNLPILRVLYMYSRMGRRSNKSLEIALAPIVSNIELDRKITLATECFTTSKGSELILRDRTRLSEQNALTVCNYIIAFKHEANPMPSYVKYTIQFLSELSKTVGIEKQKLTLGIDKEVIESAEAAGINISAMTENLLNWW